MTINRRQFLSVAPATAGAAALTLGGGIARAADVPCSVARGTKLVPPDGGRAIWWMGDDQIRFQALTADTGGAYTWWIEEPPAGVGPPRHVHSREEEGFYVLDGEVVFQAGRLKATAGPGMFIALPAGIPHGWVNGKTQARLITFTAGAGNEGFHLAEEVPTIDKADALVRRTGVEAASSEDANDVVYEFEASRDYDPSADLGKIKARLLTVNFADDELNLPGFSDLDQVIKQVKGGRSVVVPATAGTHGHSTLKLGKVWGKQVAEFLADGK